MWPLRAPIRLLVGAGDGAIMKCVMTCQPQECWPAGFDSCVNNVLSRHDGEEVVMKTGDEPIWLAVWRC